MYTVQNFLGNQSKKYLLGLKDFLMQKIPSTKFGFASFCFLKIIKGKTNQFWFMSYQIEF